MELTSALTVLGRDDDHDVDLELDLADIAVSSSRLPYELGEPHVFELAFPGWLDAENVGWTRGEDHTVRPGDEVHDVLADAVERRSGLYVDADGDGEPDER